MSKNDKTPRRVQSVWPYDEEILQDLQDTLAAERKRAAKERRRNLYKLLTPEQKREYDEFKAAIRKRKSDLEILAKSDDAPPPVLLVELSRQQQKIVSLLWEEPVTHRAFEESIWPTPVNPETYRKAIDRLNLRFEELGENLTVCCKGQYYSLDRPDKL